MAMDDSDVTRAGGRAEIDTDVSVSFKPVARVDLPRYPLKLLVLPAVILLGLFLQHIIQDPSFLNHDCAFLLHGARLLMDGKKPFVDFVDMVPPLAFYSFIPVWVISKLSAVSIELTWSLICWSTVLISTVAGIMVTRNSTNWRVNDWLSLGPLFVSFLLLNLVFLYHTGQREYLFVVSFFVVFLIRWQRSLGNSINPYIAGMAGFACAFTCFIKPQLLLIVFLLESYWFLFTLVQFEKQRYKLARAPEMVAGLSTYVASFLVSFLIPNIDLYYTRWIPLVSKGYASFNPPIENTLLFATNFGQIFGDRLLVSFMLVTALVMIRRTTLLPPLLLWTFGGWLVYLVQGKGWAYHSIPLVAGYFLVSGVMIAQLAILILEFASRFTRKLEFLKPCFNGAYFSSGDWFQPYENCIGKPSGKRKSSSTNEATSAIGENGDQPSFLNSEISSDADGSRNENVDLHSADANDKNKTRVALHAAICHFAVLVFVLYGTFLLPTSGNLVHDSTASGTVLGTLDGVVESETKPGDSIMIVATNFAAIYPMVVHKDRRQSTRYLWCFNFPMLLYLQQETASGGKWDGEVSRFVNEVAQDIAKTWPKLIAIESRCPWPLHAHMFGNSGIKDLLSHYEPLGDYNGFAVWKMKPINSSSNVSSKAGEKAHE